MSEKLNHPIEIGLQRVYYLTSAQYGLSNIALKRLKISRFSDLNDPFELLAIDLTDIDLRAGMSAKKKQIDENMGLICFSWSYRNPLLWGHYGDKHRGMCLGFDVPGKLLTKVEYVKGLHKISVKKAISENDSLDRLLERLRYTKFSDWRYEEELRWFVDLHGFHDESGLYFMTFSETLALREVILGPRCDLPIKAIRSLVKDFSPPIKVSKTKISLNQFAVIEDHSFRMEL